MKIKSSIWKIVVIIIAILLYLSLLVYISSIQTDYKASITTEQKEYRFSTEDKTPYIIMVKVKNSSNRTIGSAPEYNVFLSYHLYDTEGKLICYDNIRSPLDSNIFAHSKGTSSLLVSPLDCGEYILKIDLLEEGVRWFSEQDEQLYSIKVNIQ